MSPNILQEKDRGEGPSCLWAAAFGMQGSVFMRGSSGANHEDYALIMEAP